MYPLYFVIGGLAPFGVLVCFLLVADVGIIAKNVAWLVFASILALQALVPADCIPLIPVESQPLVWMVVRIGYALFLWVWMKANELGL